MTEGDAKGWLLNEIDVSRETLGRIEAFLDLLREENCHQNLVSEATVDCVWSRHVVDSIQLLRHVPKTGHWLDLGSGAGFPGLMVALLHPDQVTLVEQRKLRVAFLERAAAKLALGDRVTIVCANVRQYGHGPFDIISARAFAPLDRLFAMAHHLAANETNWVLPKGRQAKTELDAARRSWQGVFRLEPSITDPDASIIVAEGVRPLAKRKRAP